MIFYSKDFHYMKKEVKRSELVCLMDQLDATHFLPDYGVETPEQEKKTMAMMPISIDDIEKVVYRPKGAQ